MDSTKLELLKNKEEHAQSAIASQEVREHLACFILTKRQGSSTTQINTIQNQTSIQRQPAKDGCTAQCVEVMNGGVQHDDHPLRKTASMPTMHIPYKAQSLSRRRQMERRTTMSPLIKRKPKRQLLHSQNSSPEYCSNPCITNSNQTTTRKHSQSNSPSPLHHVIKGTAGQQQYNPSAQPQQQQPQRQPQQDRMTVIMSPQTIKLNYIPQQELENLQNSMKNSLYCSNASTIHSSSGTPSQSSTLSNIELHCSSKDSNNSLQQSSLVDKSALRQQQLKVNEVIRKSAFLRATSKGRIFASGSLDNEGTSSVKEVEDRGNNSTLQRDSLRQLSLDGADLRTNAVLNKLSANAPMSNVFHRGLHKIRLATTSDAATLRRLQSPSSSISMGLSNNQAAAMKINNPSQYSRDTRPGNRIGLARYYSSSSSSNSSLLSQQDSLEDSSSQAMDLSSSSEARRQLHHAVYPSRFNVAASTAPHRCQLAGQLMKSNSGSGAQVASVLTSQQKHYQKLQDSFNQLQLCHSQEGIKQLLHSQAQQSHQQQNIGPKGINHPPSLLNASKTAFSLDAANSHQAKMTNSLSEQFNLSASAKNLVSLRDHVQQVQNSSILTQQAVDHQQTHDLNQWLLAYTNLLQTTEVQGTSQLISSTLSKISDLPEQYRAAVLTQIMQHQRQQHLQLQVNLLNSVIVSPETTFGLNNSEQRATQELDQRALIGRALSSPLLAISNAGTSISPIQQQQQDQAMDCGTHQGAGEPNEDKARGFAKATFSLGEPTEMIVDCPVNETMITDDAFERKSETSSIADNHSLDLTTSSRSSEDRSRCSLPVGREPAVNFKYTLADSKRASYSFIYTPVFDDSSHTGLIYELEMCNHKCVCGNENNHAETSYRILSIWKRLHDKGLMAKCAKIKARRATLEEIQLCHSKAYSNYFGRSPFERIRLSQFDLTGLPIQGLTQLECGGQGADLDCAWNEEQTPGVARLAVGCVIEAAVSVAKGELMNAFAVVRPPGNHAESQQALGFCFFNSIAIAARVLISKHRLARILIVDWDIHHGNGIQKMFYEDKSVMYISLHRHDKGNFFPGTGSTKEIGAGEGEGFNWNIAWTNETMGDAEYLAAFRSLVMPIAREYNPSMVLVACGFDAACGHLFNYGGYQVSPAAFAFMTRQLMTLANGRLVLCLEGGYHLESICDCAESCVRALLDEPIIEPLDQVRDSELRREPNPSARGVMLEVSKLADRFWPSVERWRNMIELSALDAANMR